MAGDPYLQLSSDLAVAGFFATSTENMGTWHRTTACSKLKDGRLSGNSFWISRLRGDWYVGTWGGHIYRLSQPERATELCVAWLSKFPDVTTSDFDEHLKTEFGLVLVSEEDFDHVIQVADD